MRIGNGSVVVFDFVLSDEEGNEIDSGKGPDGMAYIHGFGQIVPGLERVLEGREVGDSLKAVVPPEEGYGDEEEQDEVRVPRTELPDDLEIGAELEGTSTEGETETFWVVAIEGDDVVMTRTHPLAGMTLTFDVTVTKVRAATEEELEHGHAHEGAHDHAHDHSHD
jgi:FKBP-type peptidyl-prolyl cis-trans isomerase SlyD